MTAPLRRLGAVCLVAGLLASAAPVAPAHASGTHPAAQPAKPAKAARAAKARAATTSLTVRVERLTPSTLPQRPPPRARVVVAGTVANRSEEAWTDLAVYLVAPAAPLASRAELAAAAQRGAVAGRRIVAEGHYDADVADLAPGAATRFRLSVPTRALGASEPGVYELAVQVLASSADGARDTVADAAARLFVPLLPDSAPSTTLALAVPFRGLSTRAPDGRLANLAAWQESVAPRGRMRRLMELARTAAPVRSTWLLDPSVLDSVRSVAAGDPPLDLGPARGGAGPAGTAQPTTDAAEAADETGADADPPAPGAPAAPAQAARSWLEEFTAALPRQPLMTLPYGDMDVAAALRTGFDRTFAQAVQRSADAAEALTATATPVVAPPTGRLPTEALTFLPAGARLLLARGSLRGVGRTRVDLDTGATAVLLDRAPLAGAAGAGPRGGALMMRQRILAEAALHALGPRRSQPLVVSLPARWDPGPRWRRSRFFPGLRVPWLVTTDVPAVLARPAQGPAVAPTPQRVAYPESEAASEVPLQNFAVVQRMTRAGDGLAGLLTFNDSVDEQVERHALLSVSTWVRSFPRRAAARAEAGREHIEELTGRIGIRTQSFVTMSSGTGSFQVTLVNGLDQPVTAGVRAVAVDRALTIQTPAPVRLPGGERRTVRVEVTASDIGVHRVTVEPTNADGVPMGARTTFDVRSSNVGLIIWVIMGVGAAVLFVAVALRVARRVRRRRATPGPLLPREPVEHR